MKIEFQFISGTLAGRRIELDEKERLRIGRHPDNDIAFDSQRDLNVSGHHAELRREGGCFVLVDIGSSNGTFMSGEKITRAQIASGAEVTFGKDGPRLLIRFIDDAPTVAARGEGQQQPALHQPPPPARHPPPPVQAPPSAPSSPAGAAPEKKIGARTVAMMIDSAMVKARTEKKGGIGKSTVFMRAMVNQAVTTSTRRFKMVSLILTLVLVGTVGGFLVLRHFERQDARDTEATVRKEMAKLMDRQRNASSSDKERLAKRLEQLNRKLASARQGGGKEIVTQNRNAVFLIAFKHPTKGLKGFCTAFALRRHILGTNAHCVIALEKFRASGYPCFVVMNRNPAQKHNIVRVTHHPGYHKPRRSISKDVGLLEISGALSSHVKIAPAKRLRVLESGDVMYMYGFPGRLANVSSPMATLVQGVVGRVTRLDGSMGNFSQSLLIQHSAFTSGGTSGSPIFNEDGEVIAVNTGGYVEPGSLQIMDPSTGKSNRLMVAKQLAGYNFGIRIDVLSQLLADLGK